MAEAGNVAMIEMGDMAMPDKVALWGDRRRDRETKQKQLVSSLQRDLQCLIDFCSPSNGVTVWDVTDQQGRHDVRVTHGPVGPAYGTEAQVERLAVTMSYEAERLHRNLKTKKALGIQITAVGSGTGAYLLYRVVQFIGSVGFPSGRFFDAWESFIVGRTNSAWNYNNVAFISSIILIDPVLPFPLPPTTKNVDEPSFPFYYAQVDFTNPIQFPPLLVFQHSPEEITKTAALDINIEIAGGNVGRVLRAETISGAQLTSTGLNFLRALRRGEDRPGSRPGVPGALPVIYSAPQQPPNVSGRVPPGSTSGPPRTRGPESDRHVEMETLNRRLANTNFKETPIPSETKYCVICRRSGAGPCHSGCGGFFCSEDCYRDNEHMKRCNGPR